MKLRLLLVEDSENDAALLLRALERGGHQVAVHRVETAEALKQELLRDRWDAVISDFNLPQLSGLQALEIVKKSGLDLPFLIVSGTVGEDVAVEVMRAGAHDYVMKSNLTRLPMSLEREVREAQVRSERSSLEEQLRQAQKMEAVGQLAGGVAHDFNNLLTAILSFSRFAYEDLGPEHPTREDLQEVIECAERAAGLTRQLLAVSRRQMFQPQLLDLGQILVTTEKLLKRLLSADIKLVVKVEGDLWRVRADSGHIEQVILNLVVNARDAMPDGGTLTLQVGNVELGESYARGRINAEAGPFVVLSVTDTGTGMTDEVQGHAFEPFFTTKGPGKGTGLGLATVYGIVKQWGGHILIDSALGRGTAFRVYLPRCDEVEEPEVAPPQDQRARGNERVLVVEDEDAVRAVARRALQTAGYTVVEAAEPNEAIAQLEAQDKPLDLVLTDIVLPEMNGKDLVDRLRQMQPTLKALLMSGYAAGGSTVRTSSGSSLPYLQKPFTPELLVQRVRAVLDGQRAAR